MLGHGGERADGGGGVERRPAGRGDRGVEQRAECGLGCAFGDGCLLGGLTALGEQGEDVGRHVLQTNT